MKGFISCHGQLLISWTVLINGGHIFTFDQPCPWESIGTLVPFAPKIVILRIGQMKYVYQSA
jgi:hypothetical protein